MSDMATNSNRTEVPDDTIIEAILRADEPFATAEELSEQLSLSRQAVNQRLRQLKAEGFLERKQCGSGYGWWVVEQPA